MKRSLLAFVAVLQLFIACDQTPKYSIKGTVAEGMDGKKVYLRKLTETGPAGVASDSAVLSKGAFEMRGAVTDPDLYFITVEGGSMPNLVFMENATIGVNVDLKDPKKSSVTGSALNDLYTIYKDSVAGFNTSLQNIANEYRDLSESGTATEEQLESLSKKYQGVKDQSMNYRKRFLKGNPNSLVTSYVLGMSLDDLDMEDVDSIFSTFDDQLKKTVVASQIGNLLAKWRATAVGQPFVDLKLTAPDGAEIAISDYAGKGKYVLLDFWASWCGPCRKENPNFVRLYNKYAGADFEIVGVSLDKDAANWAKGIADDKITWPQMSDLKAWQSVAVETYNIRGIPHTVLLDREGTIIANNLRGEELEAKLQELLGK